jgi:hypothetical protein
MLFLKPLIALALLVLLAACGDSLIPRYGEASLAADAGSHGYESWPRHAGVFRAAAP